MAPRQKPTARPAPRRTPMAVRAARPAETVATPAPARMDPATARAGRTAAILLVGTGLFWIAATWAGGALGLTQRVRALFDLFALAGFGLALWMTYGVWRRRRSQVE